MRTIHRLAAIAAIFVIATSCAAKLPPADTFNPPAWARVGALTPGTRVEVRYVSTVTGKPLQQHFEGKLVAATADILEVETRHGLQRLLPHRVTRVAAGERTRRVVPLAVVGALIGALLRGMLAAMGERNDDEISKQTWIGGLFGSAVGAAGGFAMGEKRPVTIYSRGGSR